VWLFEKFAKLNAFEGNSTIARGLVIVPSLSGLACPHGAWMGLESDTSKRDLMQAVLEGITFRMAEVIAAIDQLQPISEPIPITGGLSANAYFRHFFVVCHGARRCCVKPT
jgi:glycerol kinase